MGNINPMMLISAIKNGQNPQQLVMNILENNMGQTPMGQNLLNLAKNNKIGEIENIARNYVSQRGGDFDAEFSAFKHSLGIK